jgi:hypothetical protein
LGRRGPQSLGNDVRLEVTVSAEIDRALSQVVELSGMSRMTIVRQALLDQLSALGVLFPEIAESLVPTATRNNRRNK